MTDEVRYGTKRLSSLPKEVQELFAQELRARVNAACLAYGSGYGENPQDSRYVALLQASLAGASFVIEELGKDYVEGRQEAKRRAERGCPPDCTLSGAHGHAAPLVQTVETAVAKRAVAEVEQAAQAMGATEPPKPSASSPRAERQPRTRFRIKTMNAKGMEKELQELGFDVINFEWVVVKELPEAQILHQKLKGRIPLKMEAA